MLLVIVLPLTTFSQQPTVKVRTINNTSISGYSINSNGQYLSNFRFYFDDTLALKRISSTLIDMQSGELVDHSRDSYFKFFDGIAARVSYPQLPDRSVIDNMILNDTTLEKLHVDFSIPEGELIVSIRDKMVVTGIPLSDTSYGHRLAKMYYKINGNILEPLSFKLMYKGGVSNLTSNYVATFDKEKRKIQVQSTLDKLEVYKFKYKGKDAKLLHNPKEKFSITIVVINDELLIVRAVNSEYKTVYRLYNFKTGKHLKDIEPDEIMYAPILSQSLFNERYFCFEDWSNENVEGV